MPASIPRDECRLTGPTNAALRGTSCRHDDVSDDRGRGIFRAARASRYYLTHPDWIIHCNFEYDSPFALQCGSLIVRQPAAAI